MRVAEIRPFVDLRGQELLGPGIDAAAPIRTSWGTWSATAVGIGGGGQIRPFSCGPHWGFIRLCPAWLSIDVTGNGRLWGTWSATAVR
jgi:hypothetical protein